MQRSVLLSSLRCTSLCRPSLYVTAASRAALPQKQQQCTAAQHRLQLRQYRLAATYSNSATYVAARRHLHTSTVTMTQPAQPSIQHLLEHGKHIVAQLVIAAATHAYKHADPPRDVDISDMHADIVSKCQKPTVSSHGDLTLPLFTFAKRLGGGKPDVIAATIYSGLIAVTGAETDGTVPHASSSSSSSTRAAGSEAIASIHLKGAYINFFLSTRFLAQVLTHISSGTYLAPLTDTGKTKVMIEYSQPNTHKAFHVGHMRNAALGDTLRRLYEQCGHEVVPTTYYGDEGAHVAKCLWWLQKYMQQHNLTLNDLEAHVPADQRGEWLGAKYSEAVSKLDLVSYTTWPYPEVIAAHAVDVQPHPAADAPKNWRVVTLAVDTAGTQTTVVCGGRGYHTGDKVAYMPVGGTLGKGGPLAAKDMKGVTSHGMILSKKELGLDEEHETEEGNTNVAVKPVEKAVKPNKEHNLQQGKQGGAGADGKQAKGGKKDGAAGKAAAEAPIDLNDQIVVLPADVPVGVQLTEYGRIAGTDAPAVVPLVDFINQRKAESKLVLRALETGDAEMVHLWRSTGEWSLAEFRRIHSWLDCKFDKEFFESMVSEESVKLVKQLFADGKLVASNGAIGADLNQYKLGFCLLLKSNGSGLYATKDLALAKRKFDEYGIDQSIYVVDAAQSLHFKQVFKILETIMQYEQAKLCYHLSYGQVVLPEGRMKSRSGRVVLFSQLRQELGQQIYADFLQQHSAEYQQQHKQEAAAAEQAQADGQRDRPYVKDVDVWGEYEIAAAQRIISVATIRYGMLNHDTTKDIVFVMKEWAAGSGNTGPYMLYAYARIQSIIRQVEAKIGAAQQQQPNYSLLTHPSERTVLLALNDFWTVVEAAKTNNNPSSVCSYVFELAKAFTSFYDQCSVANAATDELRVARLAFIKSIAATIKQSLYLLGIQTLDRM